MAFGLSHASASQEEIEISNEDKNVTFHAVIKACRWKSEGDDGYVILVCTPDKKRKLKEKINNVDISSLKEFNLKGNAKDLADAENLYGRKIEVFGKSSKLTHDKKYGYTFAFEMVKDTFPEGADEIVPFLSQSNIKHIGQARAQEIVKRFGMQTIDVFDNRPDLLLEVRGINQRMLESIKKDWAALRSKMELMNYLCLNGFTGKAVNKICDVFDSVQAVKDNVYEIAKIEGISFIRVDEFALSAGLVHQHDFARLKAAILHYLEENIQRSGDTIVKKSVIIKEVFRTLNKNQKDKISLEDLEESLSLLVQEEDVVIQEHVFLVKQEDDNGRYVIDEDKAVGIRQLKYAKAEKSIARELRRLINAESYFDELTMGQVVDDYIADINEVATAQKSNTQQSDEEKSDAVVLDDSQEEALRLVLTNKVSILTGGPGTGKTTTLKNIIAALKSISYDGEYVKDFMNSGVKMANLKIGLMAPTGRAAKKMEESTGMEAKTIHRHLGYSGKTFTHNKGNPLDFDVVIVDESSMIDTMLVNSLLNAIKSTAVVVFVGDVDQLQSVSPGNVLSDFIKSGCVPVARLTKIHRQAQDSNIIKVAHAVVTHTLPEYATRQHSQEEMELSEDGLSKDDLIFIETKNSHETLEKIEWVIDTAKKHGIDEKDIQILTPRNGSSSSETDEEKTSVDVLTVDSLNKNPSIRSLLNKKFQKAAQKLNIFEYSAGDRVMQLKNDAENDVYNGDVGYITKLSLDKKNGDVVFGVMGSGKERVLNMLLKSNNDLQLAYAATIHKSQGSDYPYVIIPLSKSHQFQWNNSLLYTAITRGKKKVVLVGDLSVLRSAVRVENKAVRQTVLEEEIKSVLLV